MGSVFLNVTYTGNTFFIHFFLEVEYWFGFAVNILRNIHPGYGLYFTVIPITG